MSAPKSTRRLVRIFVDPHLCVGSTMCIGAYPQLFALQSDGHAAFLGSAADESAAADAAELCPVSAITLQYDEA